MASTQEAPKAEVATPAATAPAASAAPAAATPTPSSPGGTTTAVAAPAAPAADGGSPRGAGETTTVADSSAAAGAAWGAPSSTDMLSPRNPESVVSAGVSDMGAYGHGQVLPSGNPFALQGAERAPEGNDTFLVDELMNDHIKGPHPSIRSSVMAQSAVSPEGHHHINASKLAAGASVKPVWEDYVASPISSDKLLRRGCTATRGSGSDFPYISSERMASGPRPLATTGFPSISSETLAASPTRLSPVTSYPTISSETLAASPKPLSPLFATSFPTIGSERVLGAPKPLPAAGPGMSPYPQISSQAILARQTFSTQPVQASSSPYGPPSPYSPIRFDTLLAAEANQQGGRSPPGSPSSPTRTRQELRLGSPEAAVALSDFSPAVSRELNALQQNFKSHASTVGSTTVDFNDMSPMSDNTDYLSQALATTAGMQHSRRLEKYERGINSFV